MSFSLKFKPHKYLFDLYEHCLVTFPKSDVKVSICRRKPNFHLNNNTSRYEIVKSYKDGSIYSYKIMFEVMRSDKTPLDELYMKNIKQVRSFLKEIKDEIRASKPKNNARAVSSSKRKTARNSQL